MTNMTTFTEIGFLSLSRFTRLSAAGIEALKPVTVLPEGDRPVGVVVQYERYIGLQAEMEHLKSSIGVQTDEREHAN